ncbi:virulence factor TspB C-terminal domain-related protein [Acinetobacter radioresistens]|uniref:virulence factor TspB C-terminal domain-related protein n=2 Tax=Acinetobacter radioresistens TaxID=40216 RepID=UPI00055977B2|nr:virulence factor TspB C-terminal domain-related protein [Acinetobacter radioresistens]
MKCLNSRLITIFICLNLALFPSFLFAGNIGGWSLGSPVASGASAIVNGTKEIILNGASKIAKGTAKITPNASQVAKVLRNGVAGYALSVAVEQLLGAVDWVLDAENNKIRYRTEPDQCQYLYKYKGKDYCPKALAAAANKFYLDMGFENPDCSVHIPNVGGTATIECAGLGGTVGSASPILNPDYSETAEDDYPKSIPLETVAQKVISNAAGGDVSAQQATMSAAQEIINDAEKDSAKAAPIVQQLEASKAIEEENTATGEQTQNPEKPNVTDISLEFPAFCGWAPTVCEAAQTVISFPRTLTNWWNTANQKADGWASSISLAWSDFWKEPNLEKEKDTEVNVDEKEVQDPSQFDQMYVQFGGQCPTFEVNTISVGSVSVPISFDLSPYCDFALKVRPAVIGFGYLVALGIVSNAIREV